MEMKEVTLTVENLKEYLRRKSIIVMTDKTTNLDI